jgi:hypothetical protein
MLLLTLPLRILLASFAAYRLARMITLEEGPFEAFLRLRERLGVYDRAENGQPRTSLGRLFECPYCMGVWASMILALFIFRPSAFGDGVLIVLGMAGIQAFIQGIGSR